MSTRVRANHDDVQQGGQVAREDASDTGGRVRRDRRRRPPPSTPLGYLLQMPALVLLDRLPTPMLAVGLDGVLIYANPAFVRMLGYAATATLSGQSLPTLLSGHPEACPQDCVTALRNAGTTVTDWSHADGFSIHTVISAPLLTRADDPIVLISITDISEFLWNTASIAE